MTLQEIVERLEAAKGPDRKLDAEIALASGKYVREKRGRDRQEWFYPVSGSKYVRKALHYGSTGMALERYTASVDDALTLVPEGMRRRVMVVEDGRAAVQLCWPDDDWPSEWGRLLATECLALCVAALRARMEEERLEDYTLEDHLRGPHEWGYRDPATGDFIHDDRPYEAATTIESLRRERDEAREALRKGKA